MTLNCRHLMQNIKYVKIKCSAGEATLMLKPQMVLFIQWKFSKCILTLVCAKLFICFVFSFNFLKSPRLSPLPLFSFKFPLCSFNFVQESGKGKYCFQIANQSPFREIKNL